MSYNDKLPAESGDEAIQTKHFRIRKNPTTLTNQHRDTARSSFNN